MQVRQTYPELMPLKSYHAYYRRLKKDVPHSVIAYFRGGRKVFDDSVQMYVQRQYETLSSNEIWIADFHTFDLFVQDDSGKVFRPHLIGYLDARLRKMVGWKVARTSNSNDNFLAFMEAVMRHGIPESVYVDNGVEFLVHDFGGRGHRKKMPQAFEIPTLLEQLGLQMINAQVAKYWRFIHLDKHGRR